MSDKAREIFYFATSAVVALVGLAVTLGAIDQGVADNIGQLVLGLGGLFGATGPALAGAKLDRQRKDGILEPRPIELPPALSAAQSIHTIGDEIADLVARVTDGALQVRSAADAVGSLGVRADLPGPVKDLIEATRQHREDR